MLLFVHENVNLFQFLNFLFRLKLTFANRVDSQSTSNKRNVDEISVSLSCWNNWRCFRKSKVFCEISICFFKNIIELEWNGNGMKNLALKIGGMGMEWE